MENLESFDKNKYNKIQTTTSLTEQWNDKTFIRAAYPFLEWIPVYKSGSGTEERRVGNEPNKESLLNEDVKSETNKTGKSCDVEFKSQNVPIRSVEILYLRTDKIDYVTESLKRHIHLSDVNEEEFCGKSLHLLCHNFHKFLEESVSKGDARYPIVGEGKDVCMFVEDVVAELRNFLDCEFQMFKGCQILKTGSSYEKTKIGKPDEFDLMIELPVLAENGTILFSLFDDETGEIPGLVSCDIVNPTFFQDVCTHPMSEHKQLQDGFFKPTDLTLELDFCSVPIVKILLVRISRIIRAKLNEILPQEAKYKGIHLQPTVGKAMTFTMIWKGDKFPWLPISVDFVVGIPLERSDSLKIPPNKTYHAVFHNHASRISSSLFEIEIFRHFGVTDGPNKCMRILKMLRDRYTPTEFDFFQERLELSKDSLLPTFWLKHIMLYMYKKYENMEEKFSEEQLPFRVVEALEILTECCKRRLLYNFFIPNCNLMSVDGDTKEQKIENLELIRSDVGELITHINSMEKNEMALQERHETVKSRDQLTQTVVDKMYFEYLIGRLAQYAARGYTGDELSVLRACCAHINDFSGGDYVITGEGEHIAFIVRGKQINIVGELLKMHKKEIENKSRGENEIHS